MSYHNLSVLGSVDNPILGAILEVNNGLGGLWGVFVIILILIVSTFVFIRQTQDTSKSVLSALHIASILSIILYFGGLTAGVSLIPDIFVLGLIVVEIIGLVAVKLSRIKDL